MDDSIFEILFCDRAIVKISTEECLTKYYKKQGYNIFKAAEYAQNNRLNFVEFVNKSINNSHNLNVPYLFSFASNDIIIINDRYFPIKKIQTSLTVMDWRDFELISATILENCFGAIDVKTTSPTADGGLDFEGKIPIKPTLSNNVYGYIEVYGQSKKYTGHVGIYEIKSFVAFANSKKRNYVHPSQLFMFFTSSDYAINAMRELKINGFIGLSGFQLANLIYDHKNVLSEKSPILNKIIHQPSKPI
jgi:Restriction endonuclease